MNADDCPTAVPATLTWESAAARTWDVVVAGAGPAGAMAARGLAAAGAAVLLVDKATFPRDKVCGSCLNGAALAALETAGLGELPACLGGVPLRAMRLHVGRQEAVLPLPQGVSLSRRALDAALLQAAIQAGAAFLPGAEARLEGADENGPQVRLRDARQRIVVRARIAIAADGLVGTFLKDQPGMQPVVAGNSLIGAGAVLDDGPSAYAPGTIYMACGRDGYVGVVRLEDGRIDVAAALDLQRMRRAGSVGAAAAEILQSAGFPSLPAAAVADFRGTPRLTRRRPRVAAPGLFVLGDAAGYLEPFTGQGIAFALQQALLLTPLAREALAHPDPRHAALWQQQYTRFFQQQRRVCGAAIWMRRHFALGTLVVRLLSRMPSLAGPWVRALNQPSTELLRSPAR